MKSKGKIILIIVLVLFAGAISAYLIIHKQKEEDNINKPIETVDENSITLSTDHIILDKNGIGQTQKIEIKSACSIEEIDCQVQFSTMSNLVLEEYITYEISGYEIDFVCSQAFPDSIILTVSNQVNQSQCQIDCLQDIQKINVTISRDSFNFLLDSSTKIAIPLCEENAVYELDVVGEYYPYSLSRDCPVQCHLYLANEVQAVLTEKSVQYQVQYDFVPDSGLNLTLDGIHAMFQISKDFVDWKNLFEDSVIFILEIEMGSLSELYSIYYKEEFPIGITSIVLTENIIIL